MTTQTMRNENQWSFSLLHVSIWLRSMLESEGNKHIRLSFLPVLQGTLDSSRVRRSTSCILSDWLNNRKSEFEYSQNPEQASLWAKTLDALKDYESFARCVSTPRFHFPSSLVTSYSEKADSESKFSQDGLPDHVRRQYWRELSYYAMTLYRNRLAYSAMGFDPPSLMQLNP